MDHNIGLIVALGVPFLLMLFLRINAAMVFLSLCLGEVMVLYVASEAEGMMRGSIPHLNQASTSTMKLIVLLVPAVVTAILTAFSVHGKLKNIGNIFPALGASALGVLLAVPLLAPAMRLSIKSQPMWHYLSSAEALIVGVGGLVSLMFLWSQRSHFKQHDKKHKH